ncbi:MAG TPA: sensor histidine kinase [Polyangiaceae bacterium]|jgi:hypothetical protein
MLLAEFIRENHEAILVEWEKFARTLGPSDEGMGVAALRDHAEEMLSEIARDMGSRQSAQEQVEKSKGQKPSGKLGSLSQAHASGRVEGGFSLAELVAEYRALRASVFRLWRSSGQDPDGVIRFNEAIDEALGAAVGRYIFRMDQYREQLIAIASHDLRNPLGGILFSAEALVCQHQLDDTSARVVVRIENSAKRMVRIVSDLLDLTRTRLGSGIPIARGAADLGDVCTLAVSELEAANPNAELRFTAAGDLRGQWDSDRLAQVVSNLVGNALQHGDVSQPIDVVARGDRDEVVLEVHNRGPTIPGALLNKIFEPMVRRREGSGRSTGLGLGLYIAKEIVLAHGGTLDARSTEAEGTTFMARLPRS